MKWHKVQLAALCATVLTGAARADTITYLRFEEGPAGAGLTAVTGGPGTLTADASGNGNSYRTYNSPATPANNFDTSPRYLAGVPAPTVPLTGLANNFSFDFGPGNGGDSARNDDIYPNAAGSLNTTDFNNFTIEAFVRFDAAADGHQTFIGRDDNGNPGELASPEAQMYFKQAPNGRIEIIAYDSAGTRAFIDSAGTGGADAFETVAANTWYHLAVTGSADTDLLTLYVNGVQQGTAPLVDGLFDSPTDTSFTIGRGQYNGGPADFMDGAVDEVRFSNVALAPSQFLNAVPEPASLGLLGMGAIGLLARRRKV